MMLLGIDNTTGNTFDVTVEDEIFYFENLISSGKGNYKVERLMFLSDQEYLTFSCNSDSLLRCISLSGIKKATDTVNSTEYFSQWTLENKAVTSRGTKATVYVDGTYYIHVIYLYVVSWEEAISFENEDIYNAYLICKNSLSGTIVDVLHVTARNSDVLADIHYSYQIIPEDKKLGVLLNNAGMPIPSDYMQAVYPGKIQTDVADYTLLNRKRKEYLSEVAVLRADKGNYSSLSANLEWFEWDGKLALYDFYTSKDTFAAERQSMFPLLTASKTISELLYRDNNHLSIICDLWEPRTNNGDLVYENDDDDVFNTFPGSQYSDVTWLPAKSDGNFSDADRTLNYTDSSYKFGTEERTLENYPGANLTKIVRDTDKNYFTADPNRLILSAIDFDFDITEIMLKLSKLESVFPKFIAIYNKLRHCTVRTTVIPNSIKTYSFLKGGNITDTINPVINTEITITPTDDVFCLDSEVVVDRDSTAVGLCYQMYFRGIGALGTINIPELPTGTEEIIFSCEDWSEPQCLFFKNTNTSFSDNIIFFEEGTAKKILVDFVVNGMHYYQTVTADVYDTKIKDIYFRKFTRCAQQVPDQMLAEFWNKNGSQIDHTFFADNSTPEVFTDEQEIPDSAGKNTLVRLYTGKIALSSTDEEITAAENSALAAVTARDNWRQFRWFASHKKASDAIYICINGLSRWYSDQFTMPDWINDKTVAFSKTIVKKYIPELHIMQDSDDYAIKSTDVFAIVPEDDEEKPYYKSITGVLTPSYEYKNLVTPFNSGVVEKSYHNHIICELPSGIYKFTFHWRFGKTIKTLEKKLTIK